ncbi:unnamed protein product, partial [Ilex paraguariensis]
PFFQSAHHGFNSKYRSILQTNQFVNTKLVPITSLRVCVNLMDLAKNDQPGSGRPSGGKQTIIVKTPKKTVREIRMEPKRMCLYISIAVVLIVLSTDIQTADCSEIKKGSSWCNGTITDCIEEDDQEFLMESEVSRRILQTTNKLIVKSLKPGSAVCDPDRYGNCIVQINQYNRPCTYENRCKRSPQP